MNAEERAHWLAPSPPLAIDDSARHRRPRRAIRHETSVRDLRLRFGDPEVYLAECLCGWIGEPCPGDHADGTARRAGLAHIASQVCHGGPQAPTV